MNPRLLISLILSCALIFGGADTALASMASKADANPAQQMAKVSNGAYSSLMAKADATDGTYSSLMVTAKKSGLVKVGKRTYFYKNGKKAKGWKTVKGEKYYFKSNGQAVTGSCKIKGKYYIFGSKGALIKAKKSIKAVKVGKCRYLVDSKGVAVKGWKVIAGKLYYAYSSGRCASGKTVDKVPFNSAGYAEPDNTRTKLLIEAIPIVTKLTDDDMTRYEKLEKCWIYVNSFRYRLTQKPPNHKKGWHLPWAYTTLKVQIVNCNGIACAFAALAKVLGEDPYLVRRHNRGHMWVIINGKHWDNDFDIRDGDHAHYPLTGVTITRFW